MTGLVVVRRPRGKGLRGRAARARKRALAGEHLVKLSALGEGQRRGRVVREVPEPSPAVRQPSRRPRPVESPVALAARLGRSASSGTAAA